MQNTPPLLDNDITMVIQAMDLSLVVPLAILSGILLLRRSAWGYLLTSVFVLKAIALGLAVSAMVINMILAGTPEDAGIAIPFLVITALNISGGGSAAQEYQTLICMSEVFLIVFSTGRHNVPP